MCSYSVCSKVICTKRYVGAIRIIFVYATMLSVEFYKLKFSWISLLCIIYIEYFIEIFLFILIWFQFESVSCFWAQLFDEAHQQVSEIFNIVNKEINVTNIDAKNIKIGEFYIVVYNSEKYRAKLINIVHGTREKYRVNIFITILLLLYKYQHQY